jgi:two-component system sensor histidine kinase AtoS
MRNSSPLSNLSLRRRPHPGIHIIDELLDTLPEAALLIDAQENRLISANARVVEMTAIPRSDLIEMDLAKLFNTTDKHIFSPNEGEKERQLELQLKKRGGVLTDVQVSQTCLDTQGRWSLITLEPISLRDQRRAAINRQGQLWQALSTLAAAAQEEHLLDALCLALEAGGLLTGASLLVVYQVDGLSYSLKRLSAVGNADILPEQIHPQDVIPLQTPHLWTPGKRSQSSLHRAARASNLSFLASVPLGKPEALVGLLAVAGDQMLPSEQILDLLSVIGATITSIFQNQAIRLSLQNDIQIHATELSIAAAVREMVQDGIVIISPDLAIQDLNPSAEAILGYATREVRGQPYQNLLVGTENLIPTFITTQPGITIHDVGDIKLYRRNGVSFLAHVRTIPIVIDNELANFMILIQDLSQEEEFRLHNQTLEQRAVLGELNASFAHEVRNPINNLSTGLQVMALNLPQDNPNQELISRLQQDCERMEELMKQVLAFAKPFEYKMEPIDVASSIKRVLDRFRPHMARVNIHHRMTVDPDTPRVEGDQRALEQVWTNLVDNAIQAMSPDGGSLTIKIRRVTTFDNLQRVEVSVTDTGTGIPDEARDHIFEPFFTTKRNGTGLGLAITKRIVATHKGAIQLVSIPGGTVFQVQLPIACK